MVVGAGNLRGTVPMTFSGAEAEVWGVEVDAMWSPNVDVLGARMNVGGSYTWLKSKYEDYDVMIAGGNVLAPGGAEIFLLDQCEPTYASTGAIGCFVSYDGKRLEDAPKHAAVLTSSWVWPFFNSGVDLFFETDAQYTGRRPIDADNRAWAPEWWNANLRIGIQSDQFTLMGYVENVFDGDAPQRVYSTACCGNYAVLMRQGAGPTGFARGGELTSAPVPAAVLRDPRHFGVRAAFRF